jgi:hypothetical protein
MRVAMTKRADIGAVLLRQRGTDIRSMLATKCAHPTLPPSTSPPPDPREDEEAEVIE